MRLQAQALPADDPAQEIATVRVSGFHDNQTFGLEFEVPSDVLKRRRAGLREVVRQMTAEWMRSPVGLGAQAAREAERASVHWGVTSGVSVATVVVVLLVLLPTVALVSCEVGRSMERGSWSPSALSRGSSRLIAEERDEAEAIEFFAGRITPPRANIIRHFRRAAGWDHERAKSAIIAAVACAAAAQTGDVEKLRAIAAAQVVVCRFTVDEIDAEIERASMSEDAKTEARRRARKLLNG